MIDDDRRGFAHRATKKLVGIIIGVLFFIPLVIFLFGEAVLHLWNWLMPTIFHLGAITFWQAVGLMILGWLLFGGLRGLSGPRRCAARRGDWGPMRGRWEERWERRWQQMSPEERERFREWARTRVGQAGA
jgi:Ca2+/H+ antiporter, TMEM165/GDT1 family